MPTVQRGKAHLGFSLDTVFKRWIRYMFPLRCTVRECKELLEQIGSELRCSKGHNFDRAKSGYWSLLQPQDRKSLNPGDSEEAVLARQRWLERGHTAGLVEALQDWVKPHKNNAGDTTVTLDLGCGEGSFGRALFSDEASRFCGIDLSKKALKLAARHWPEATWVHANADRILPAADASVGRVVSLFGRRPVAEIHRVLVPDGICIVAVPGEEDLVELREQVQKTGERRRRWELVVEEMTAVGLELVEQKLWKHQVELEPAAILDAMAMTYRAVRRSEKSRLESLTATKVTLAADLILFRKPQG